MNNPNWTCGGIYTRPTDSCLFLRVSRKRGHDIPADAEDNQKDKRLASTHACSFWVKVIPDLWLQFISYWNPPLQPVRVESARHIERSVSEQARRAVWAIWELLYRNVRIHLAFPRLSLATLANEPGLGPIAF